VLYQLTVLGLKVSGDRETLWQPQENTKVTSFYPSTPGISGVCDVAESGFTTQLTIYTQQNNHFVPGRICGVAC
jgi:hypothetical protein